MKRIIPLILLLTVFQISALYGGAPDDPPPVCYYELDKDNCAQGIYREAVFPGRANCSGHRPVYSDSNCATPYIASIGSSQKAIGATSNGDTVRSESPHNDEPLNRSTRYMDNTGPEYNEGYKLKDKDKKDNMK